MSLENSFGNPADDAAGGAAEAKMPADETRRRGLAALSGFPFGVYTSESTRRRAGPLAEKCARAHSYLGELLGAAPEFALVVLDRSDWSERASDPFYGMPYYDAGNIFVAGEASDLSARLEEVASAAPASAAEILNEVYGTAADRLAPFAEMLVVHELAHAFHDSVPSGFPRAWLMELFADAALYAYVAFEEPDRLPLLETLVQVTLDYGLIKPVARDLGYFERLYPHLEPASYVWYQFRFTMMAKELLDQAGPAALRRLWETFVLSDQQLADVLGREIHPVAGQWLGSWSQTEAEA